MTCIMSSINLSFFGNLNSQWAHYVIHQNVFLMSPIKFFFFGNQASKCVAYVIHQNFLFWKSAIQMCHLCHLLDILFLETWHQYVLLMSSIKISFFGKSHDLLT